MKRVREVSVTSLRSPWETRLVVMGVDGWVATSKHITHIIRPVLLFWTVSRHLLSKNRLYKPGQSDET
jgi:hypothetical protein